MNAAKYILILSNAEQDIDEAYNWYEQRQAGIGDEFMNCLNKCFEAIRLTPNVYAFVYKNYRRALVKRFPYAVLYESIDETVFIYSVFHCSQDIEKLKGRLP